MIYHRKFDSGLQLIVKKIDGLMSVTSGIMVATGSSNEDLSKNGISHFIEHVNFKGTTTRSSFDISENAERIGSYLNAYTTKDTTCYHVKSTSEHFKEAFEILSDIFVNSNYPKEELEKEKDVVIEEINMDEDSPEDLAYELLAKAFFGEDDGYGLSILGTADTVKSFDRQDVLDYKNRFYTADNVVVSIVGNVDVKEAENLVEKLIEGRLPQKSDKRPKISTQNKCLKLKKEKDIEQVHICIAYDGIAYGSKDSNFVNVINTVLGGGMSSRLYQRIREELSLCYSVYSFPNAYRDAGSFVVYSAVNPTKYKTAYQEIKAVLKEFFENGITEDEFLRAKEQIKSTFVMGQESTAAQMNVYGKNLLMTGEVFDFDEKIADINKLSLQEVNDYIKSLFNGKDYATAVVGKNVEILE